MKPASRPHMLTEASWGRVKADLKQTIFGIYHMETSAKPYRIERSKMKRVSQKEWADHCSNFQTYDREHVLSGSSTLLETLISTRKPKKWQKSGKPHSIIGWVECLPNGEKRYFIF